MSNAFRGEGKTDGRDAKVIAETLRLRNDLTLVTAPDELVTALSVLTRNRSELNGDWVAGVNRLRSLIMSIFPGLERSLDFTSRTALTLAAEMCTPAELRRAGVKGVEKHLRKHRCWAAGISRTAQVAGRLAVEQTLVVPGEADIAAVIKRSAQRLLDLDREINDTDMTITARSQPSVGPQYRVDSRYWPHSWCRVHRRDRWQYGSLRLQRSAGILCRAGTGPTGLRADHWQPPTAQALQPSTAPGLLPCRVRELACQRRFTGVLPAKTIRGTQTQPGSHLPRPQARRRSTGTDPRRPRVHASASDVIA